jgi:hypothetical protein
MGRWFGSTYKRPGLTCPSTAGGWGKDETIILGKRNVPIAEIGPLKAPTRGQRPLGLAKGKIRIRECFFDPPPDELLDAFEGPRA